MTKPLICLGRHLNRGQKAPRENCIMSFSMLRKIRRVDRFGLISLVTLAISALFLVEVAQTPTAAAQDKGSISPAPGKPGLNYNSAKAVQGFTFFSPLNSTKSFLIDMEGKVVRTWEGANTAGCHAYLLPN